MPDFQFNMVNPPPDKGGPKYKCGDVVFHSDTAPEDAFGSIRGDGGHVYFPNLGTVEDRRRMDGDWWYCVSFPAAKNYGRTSFWIPEEEVKQ